MKSTRAMKKPFALLPLTRHLALGGALALVGCAALAAGEPRVALDTLLYTPLQRQQILQARQSETGEQAVTTSVSHLQGVVRRGAGKSTVWVNGNSLPEGQAQTPVLRGVDAVLAGQRLRVGEAIDALSGARSDVVVPGTVTRRMPQ
jgi:hypothetical protein